MDAAPVNADRRVFWATTFVVAVTRWFALSKTLWDWDEALFALALRDYDVTLHHPHPPGFPLFIGVAKLIPLDAFHALQCVTFVASLFVFPAAYWLARELKMTPFAATAAGVLLAFFPNVWLYGGTAFSDVPSLVLVLVACALLLRGNVVAGAVVLAIACGFRPQNLLIGFVPAILALKAQPRKAIMGALIAAVIIIASYGTAAKLSGGWNAYRDALAKHERYIRETDSFLSAIRPGLVQVADDFFVRPFRAPLINIVICVLALIGFVRRRWMPVAIFFTVSRLRLALPRLPQRESFLDRLHAAVRAAGGGRHSLTRTRDHVECRGRAIDRLDVASAADRAHHRVAAGRRDRRHSRAASENRLRRQTPRRARGSVAARCAARARDRRAADDRCAGRGVAARRGVPKREDVRAGTRTSRRNR